MKDCYRLKLANIELNYKFYSSDTFEYFKDFIVEESVEDYDLETTIEDLKHWKSLVPPDHKVSCLEQRLMVLKISRFLCRKNACVIHACAVVWKGYAWLFTGPSGIGKTTMCMNWRRYLGDEIQILNGDMPLLMAEPYKQVMVYPSPWNGKENFGSLICAPLGGIIFLEQGEENRMKRRNVSDIVAPLYAQFLCISDSEMTVQCISLIEERILETVPIWSFNNTGDLSSAKESSRVIYNYLQENNH